MNCIGSDAFIIIWKTGGARIQIKFLCPVASLQHTCWVGLNPDSADNK